VTTEHVLLGLVAEDAASKAGYLNSGLTLEARAHAGARVSGSCRAGAATGRGTVAPAADRVPPRQPPHRAPPPQRARAAVEALGGRRKANTAADNVPFGRDVRKAFEAATNVGGGGRLRPAPPATAAALPAGRGRGGGGELAAAEVATHSDYDPTVPWMLNHPSGAQECKRAGLTSIAPEHILLALLGQPDSLGRRVLVRRASDAGRAAGASAPSGPGRGACAGRVRAGAPGGRCSNPPPW
jgi:hypothetical protein